MKSINNFIGLALLSGALLTSCSDSFLQRDSLTESSSNTFWQTPDDALMALASCYDALQSNQLYNSDQYSLGPLYMDCISDNGGHSNWSGCSSDLWLWEFIPQVLLSLAVIGKIAMK